MAFHPRPQIACDLGRNVTHSSNPHQDRKQFPIRNEVLAQIQIATVLTQIASKLPNPPLHLRWSELPKSQTRRPQSQNTLSAWKAFPMYGTGNAAISATRPVRAQLVVTVPLQQSFGFHWFLAPNNHIT